MSHYRTRAYLFVVAVACLQLIPSPGHAVFTVTERSRLNAVLAEQSIGQSGLIEDAQAARAGEILGTDTILSSEISTHDHTQQLLAR